MGQRQTTRYRPADSLETPRFSGVRTFGRLPHVTDLEEVDFAVVGVPFDTGATYRVGARFGPAAIREESAIIRQYNPFHRIDVYNYLSGVDYGDLPTVPGFIEASYERIVTRLVPVLERKVVPICLGGDHSISYAHLVAASKVFGPVGIVLFDSHADTWDAYWGQKYTHGTPFRRAIEAGVLDPSRSIMVGLRGSLYDAADVVQPLELGFQVITGDELHRMGLPECLRQIRARVESAPYLWLSFDIDFVDPAYAPGTGTPEVGGFTSRESISLIRGLTGLPFIGYDVVEVLPATDPAAITALLAANLVWEMISLLAVRKRE